MRGIYFNISTKNRRFSCFSDFTSLYEYKGKLVNLSLIYSNSEWREQPVITDDQHIWCIHGWFIYKNEKNNLTKLTNDINSFGKQSLSDISAGSFLLMKLNVETEEVTFYTDPLGLSTHYIRYRDDKMEVAPSTMFFNNKDKSELMSNVIQKQGFLFGNFTAFNDIERLEPGAIITNKLIEKYYIPDFSSTVPLSAIPQKIDELVNFWDYEDRALALSGGLDSRLILAASNYCFGYTYGPESSGDRPIARQFKNEFKEYKEFSYLLPEKLKLEEEICETMFYGVSTYIYRLLSAYHYARTISGKSYVLFDGYLGDTLQRGAFLKMPGVIGEIFKLFPALYRLNLFSAEDILLKKYASLDKEQKELLLNDYRQRTKDLSTKDEFAKLTYYEFVYGRGGRFVINGGNISCNQVFTVVPVFTDLEVFHSFISQSFLDSVSYKLLDRVWSKVESKYKEVKTETGYKPDTSPFIIPYINFYNRIKLHFFSQGNYGTERDRSEKEKK